MTRYLSLEEVLMIHDRAIREFGGSDGIRDIGLVESALGRPQAGFGDFEAYLNLFLKAAVLAHSLLKNHPFVDGNKRTAIMAMTLFLLENNWALITKPGELYQLAHDIENNSLSEAKIAAWLKSHSKAKGKK